MASFTRLSGKLGLKDIFQPKFLKEASSIKVTESKTLDFRGSVETEMGIKQQAVKEQNNNSYKRFKCKTTKKKNKGIKRTV